ncbi:MAG: LytR C-terminal domain-containing protein [Actinomycetaceae bacterium]|nr:LytR C-terminal domain-containing protein [Actinomycetaceae bacterium]MDU0969649.1 LytR C-terminal domain-containing protein [Actinomycetaceae bacterium]
MTTKEYEEDEFDRAAAAQPAGAHRQPVSRMKLAWPFLVAIIVAPLLAWGMVTLFQHGSGSSESASPSQTATQQATQSTTPTSTTPAVDKAKVSVTVYNAAGVKGLAASAAEKLKTDGFTTVTPTNATGRGISQSTVYYTREDLKAPAEDAAKVLGIGTVAPKPQGFQMPDGVVVYLLSDYKQ